MCALRNTVAVDHSVDGDQVSGQHCGPVSASESHDLPSTLGRYRLRYHLASGGMASVFLALDGAAFQKLIAIKVVHSHLSAAPSAVRMFIDEARIVAAINHPNVCQMLDFGEQDGRHYLAMEYLSGEPLSSVLRKTADVVAPAFRKRVPLFAARILADAAEGLHAAHELTDEKGASLDVVHRDVSPQNVFVTYAGAVKVVDFGVARARERLEQTRVGDFKGKYAYVSPEQIRGDAFDRRADVWGLGVVLWEFLALKRLFRRPDLITTAEAILSEVVPAPSKINPAVPPALDAIVLKCLSRTPERRYQTAREVSRALRAWLTTTGHLIDGTELGEWMAALFPEERAKRLAMADAAKQGPFDGPTIEVPSAFSVAMPSHSLSALPEAPDHADEQPVDFEAEEPSVGSELSELEAASPRRLLVSVATLSCVALGLVWFAYGRAESVPVAAGEQDEADQPAALVKPSVGAAPRPAEPTPTAVDLVAVHDVADRETPPPQAEAEAPPAPPPEAAPKKAEPVAPTKPVVAAMPPAPAAAPARKPAPQPTGMVHLRSPQPTEAYLDGVLVGTTPLDLEVPVGSHQFELRSPSVAAGLTRRLDVEFASEYTLQMR